MYPSRVLRGLEARWRAWAGGAAAMESAPAVGHRGAFAGAPAPVARAAWGAGYAGLPEANGFRSVIRSLRFNPHQRLYLPNQLIHFRDAGKVVEGGRIGS